MIMKIVFRKRPFISFTVEASSPAVARDASLLSESVFFVFM